MSPTSSNSIVLITSRATESNKHFGTGFVIAQDEQVAYVLTCAHVVRDVGGEQFVEVDRHPAGVVASGTQQGFDLAVLKVQRNSGYPRLKLSGVGKKGKEFISWGFYEFASKMSPVLREIRGTLGDSVELPSHKGSYRATAWDLTLKESYLLRPGYSGAPVVDTQTDCVIGVISHQIGVGSTGLAISVAILEKIWSEIPVTILADLQSSATIGIDTPQSETMNDSFRAEKLKLIQKDIEITRKREQYLSEDIEAIVSELKICRSALDKRKLNLQMEQLENERIQVREKLKQLLEQQSRL